VRTKEDPEIFHVPSGNRTPSSAQLAMPHRRSVILCLKVPSIIHRSRNGNKISWASFIWLLTGSLRGGSNSVCTPHLLYCGLPSSHGSDCGPRHPFEDHRNEGGKSLNAVLPNHASAGNRTPSSAFEINCIPVALHTGCRFPNTPPTFTTVLHSLKSRQSCGQ
jgi:hypothetical protein